MSRFSDKTIGVICGVAAYLCWGFVALYFAVLTDRGVPPMVLLAHRVVWSLLFCLALVLILTGGRELVRVFRQPRKLAALATSSLLIAINWLAFIYAVDTHQLTEAAMGYFIVPLVSVVLGLVVLRERLNAIQWVSVCIATFGVSWIVVAGGKVPWIGLAVAFSFGFYGLVRKLTPVGPIVGLTVETAILTPVAAVYLGVATDVATFSGSTYLLLALAGAITAGLLMLYGRAAQALQLSTLGFLQYIAPTCQLFVALLVRPEAPHWWALAGFVPIWVALLIFSTESGLRSRRERRSGIIPTLRADSSTVRACDS